MGAYKDEYNDDHRWCYRLCRCHRGTKYVSFDSFDDVYITIDDYVYLQSFTAQNTFYLPNFIVEEFFQKIGQRKVLLAPEETVAIGGYAYKGGRVILEQFSDSIAQLVSERKVQLKKMSNKEMTYFSGEAL